MANAYDVVVIGAGTGGYVAAIRAAQLGLRTAVVERAPVLGGTCLNWGCIPTKALLEHAHALKIAQDAKEWGLTLGEARRSRIDMAQVQARKDKIVKGLTGGIEFLFKKNKIDWIKGTAPAAGKRRVEVTAEGDDAEARGAKEIIVATGSAPRSVPGIEIDRKRIITSDEAIDLREVPKSIAIMGSGAVGVEFASIFSRFGSEVTIIELLPRIVPRRGRSGVGRAREASSGSRASRCCTGTKVTQRQGRRDGVDDRRASSPTAGASQTIEADYLLVATGRGPVTTGLGAEEAGLQLERGYIKVDELFRTGVPGISAIGDVITFGKPGASAARAPVVGGRHLVAERIAGQEVRPINYDHVPGCTYCDPEIGSVGLTEARGAASAATTCASARSRSASSAAPRWPDETEGFVKIVAEKKYDEVLGVHMIGPRSTELVAEATLALRLECTVEELIRTIHAHPTMSEAVGEAAHAAHGAAIHMYGPAACTAIIL